MMQHRKPMLPSYGRPSGTDGSDFSYRMVVDTRYTKVAEAKSFLKALIPGQLVVHYLGALYALLSPNKDQSFHNLTVSIAVAGLFAVIIGELGRRQSRVNFLKVYTIVSSVTTLLSVGAVVMSDLTFQVLKDMSSWKSKKFELIGVGLIVFGLLAQSVTISVVTSLIHNMSPPKKSS